MIHSLPALPYAKSALAPHISEETLDYHHGKHHQAYVTNLNNLIEGSKWQESSLLEIIKNSDGGVFNNAAQVWNHTFYWHSLSPKAGKEPHGQIKKLINNFFGSFDSFKTEFSKAAIGQFGSGWAWLVQNSNDGKLSITTTSNAGCPLTTNLKPILTCDVWEHAYSIDYKNARAQYVDSFWHLVNWEFANNNLSSRNISIG